MKLWRHEAGSGSYERDQSPIEADRPINAYQCRTAPHCRGRGMLMLFTWKRISAIINAGHSTPHEQLLRFSDLFFAAAIKTGADGIV